MDKKYKEAVGCLSGEVRAILEQFPENLQKNVREVAVRAGKPLMVSLFGGEYFYSRSAGFRAGLREDTYIVPKCEVDECIRSITEYSVHSYKREINMGFITIKGGHRAGLSGSCVYENGKIFAVNDISSVNLRIARQVNGTADELCRRCFTDGIKSLLLAGPPASGKTTMLKDICRKLAGREYGYIKLSVIDERGELAAVYRGIPQNDIGINSDVFDGYQKGEGICLAVRAMSPKVIVADEIATRADAESVLEGLNAGVRVIASVHASSAEELHRKEHICKLIAKGAFEKIVVLQSAQAPCTIKEIVEPKELLQWIKQ